LGKEKQKGKKMKAVEQLIVVDCGHVSIWLKSASSNSKAIGLYEVGSFRMGGLMFLLFIRFAFWWRQKIRKAKRLLTEAEKDKEKENVIQRANISQGV